MLRRLRFRNEEGVVIFTALLVAMVVLFISLAVFALSLHNSTASGYDRKRTQAVHAAEAGLDTAMFRVQSGGTATLPCTLDGDTSTSPASHYQVTFTYYATYPITGSPMACPLTTTSPQGVLVNSTGTTGVGTSTSVSRTMQFQARLGVLYGSLDSALFSNAAFATQNNFTVNGYQGNDANVYTNGNWACANSSTLHGSALSQGTVSISQSCTVSVDVMANGSISMSNSASVGHDATSSTSAITMGNSAQIVHNAKAGTSCSGCAGRVGGTITTNSVSPPPTMLTFPQLNYDPAAWLAFGYTAQTLSNCTTAKALINDIGSAVKTVVRITPACALSWANNSTITVREDLAIITDGSITTNNQTTFQSADGTPHTVYFIVPYSAGASCTGGVHDISFSNNTTFNNVRTFTYTPCTATYNNNNAGLGGQIYAGSANITNQFTLNFFPIPIPTTDTADGFRVDVAFIREVQNP